MEYDGLYPLGTAAQWRVLRDRGHLRGKCMHTGGAETHADDGTQRADAQRNKRSFAFWSQQMGGKAHLGVYIPGRCVDVYEEGAIRKTLTRQNESSLN